MPSLTIAHFSDIHLALPEGRPALGHLLSKRLLSYISWRRSRHRIHRRTVVDALLADVRAHVPDHIAITGDLVNLSLPAEFAAARQWLETVGPPGRVTVVPGNHDALVPVPWADGLGRWQAWMQGDDAPPGPDAFPFVRVRGQVALVGVRSAVPTAPLLATGHIGQTQADRLSAILDDLGRRGLFRILLVHHPVHRAGESRRKALDDGERLTAVIARSGIELLLHGHGHVGRLDSLVGPAAPIASLGCSSASALPSHHGEAARWHLLTITRKDRGWEANVVVRRLDGTGTGFAAVGRYRLDIPAPLNI